MAKLIEVGLKIQAQPGMTGSPVIVEYPEPYRVGALAAGGHFEGQVGAITAGVAGLLNKAGNGPLLVYGGELGDPVPPAVTLRIKPRGTGVRGVDWTITGHPRDTGGGAWDGSPLTDGRAWLADEVTVSNLSSLTTRAERAVNRLGGVQATVVTDEYVSLVPTGDGTFTVGVDANGTEYVDADLPGIGGQRLVKYDPAMQLLTTARNARPQTLRGDWASAVTYARNDLTRSGGATWGSLQDNNLNHAPPTLPATSNAWWQLIAQDGVGDMRSADYVSATGTGTVRDSARLGGVAAASYARLDQAANFTAGLQMNGQAVLDAEGVQDMLGTFLRAGTGVTLTYDDAANTLTIAAAVGGLFAQATRTSSSQSIANSTATRVTFSTVNESAGGAMTTTTFTAPSAGVYAVRAHTYLDIASGQTFTFSLYRNGVALSGFSLTIPYGSTWHHNLLTLPPAMDGAVRLAAGDTLELWCTQATGASKNLSFARLDIRKASD